jgi:choline dehydrogenase-like flavoprotein
MNVFVGCGLGGTSLVNANVSLQADPRVFEDQVWPQAIRDEADAPNETPLETGYARASAMLRPTPYPDSQPTLAKMQAHEVSAQALGTPRSSTPINVTFDKGLSPAGVMQEACNGYGDCVSGCNVGAKNTTAMNYLPDAGRLAIPIRFIHGAENQTFLPESTARSVAFLEERNGTGLYDRTVIPDYGHIDCIFGKNAVNDVYPLILEHLNNSQ